MEDFFRIELCKASDILKLRLSTEREAYLVLLLSSFGKKEFTKKYLSDIYTQAIEADTVKKENEKYKELGDYALIMSGFFRGSLDDQELNYYINFGIMGYSRIGYTYPIYIELAKTFDDNRRLLEHVFSKTLGLSIIDYNNITKNKDNFKVLAGKLLDAELILKTKE